MKKFFFIFGLISILYSCKQNNSPAQMTLDKTISTVSHLDGVWKLTSYYNYKDNKIADTVYAKDDNIQVKIFADNKVMWSRKVPDGQEQYFGYGSYEISDSTLVETLEYGSTAMLKIIDTMKVFKFELIKDNDTFSQIDIGPEGTRIYSENYVKVKD